MASSATAAPLSRYQAYVAEASARLRELRDFDLDNASHVYLAVLANVHSRFAYRRPCAVLRETVDPHSGAVARGFLGGDVAAVGETVKGDGEADWAVVLAEGLHYTVYAQTGMLLTAECFARGSGAYYGALAASGAAILVIAVNGAKRSFASQAQHGRYYNGVAACTGIQFVPIRPEDRNPARDRDIMPGLDEHGSGYCDAFTEAHMPALDSLFSKHRPRAVNYRFLYDDEQEEAMERFAAARLRSVLAQDPIPVSITLEYMKFWWVRRDEFHACSPAKYDEWWKRVGAQRRQQRRNGGRCERR